MSTNFSACSFPECGKPRRANGLCTGHNQQRRHGKNLTPLRFKRPDGSPPVIEFDVDEQGCHVCRGKRDPNGYCRVSLNAKPYLVHRYVWEQVHGPLVPSLVIDHKCRNRACCNPDHLRVVSQSVNAIENSSSPSALNCLKTHCPYGHEYLPENTYFAPTGHRQCRACKRVRDRLWRARLTGVVEHASGGNGDREGGSRRADIASEVN